MLGEYWRKYRVIDEQTMLRQFAHHLFHFPSLGIGSRIFWIMRSLTTAAIIQCKSDLSPCREDDSIESER
jgi:hypothetical protein